MKDVPVLFLDLDGTVRHGKDELGRYVHGPEDVVIYPEVPPLLARYRARGWRVVGVSNQGGIALGHVTKDDVVAAIHRTRDLCGEWSFDEVLFCSHHPEAKDPFLARCGCRKPRGGLLMAGLGVLRERHYDAGELYHCSLALMVGDRPEDKGAAEACDVDFMLAADWRAGKHVIP